jgi:hypothetical protein
MEHGLVSYRAHHERRVPTSHSCETRCRTDFRNPHDVLLARKSAIGINPILEPLGDLIGPCSLSTVERKQPRMTEATWQSLGKLRQQ